MAESSGMPAPRVAVAPGTSFVEWGAVFAGGAMAAGLSFVLLTFGSAVGMSLTSPWQYSGASTKTIASLAVFWTLAQQIGAFLVGGYIAGRMRSRWAEANPDEVEFRDGLHGGLVWAVGVIIGAMVLLSTAGSVARTGAEIAGRAASAVAATSDPLSYKIDTLLRPAQAAPQAAPAAAGSATYTNADFRAEMLRTMAKSIAAGNLAANDRTYLATAIAQRTGIAQPEAERRVDDAFAQANLAAKLAADTARRSAILAGLVTAASLLISLAAAWWAGIRGGHHRDNAVPARLFPVGMTRPI